ncbi:MAG: hypothetical protein RIQ89_1446 [Bacteroidota bacterium]|jgi:undecaprenyl-diphosphatase
MHSVLESIIQLDELLFLKLNSLHHPYLDDMMWYISSIPFWIPFYFFLLIVLWRQYPRSFKWILLFLFLTIFLSDQISSSLIKNLVERPRPTHQAHLVSQIHTLRNYKGGPFGFTSSHACNSFALAAFLFFLLRKKMKILPMFMVLWALVVSYSRIYLGVHFPLDIICGGLLGWFIGWYMQKRYRFYFINRAKLNRWSFKRSSSQLFDRS